MKSYSIELERAVSRASVRVAGISSGTAGLVLEILQLGTESPCTYTRNGWNFGNAAFRT